MEESEEEGGQGERFLLVWDMYGLETAVNLDGCMSKRVQAALLEEKHDLVHPGQLIEKSLLRARFNTHRNYEVYAIMLPRGTTEEEVVGWFDKNPQGLADIVRKKGVNLHGDQGVKPVIS